MAQNRRASRGRLLGRFGLRGRVAAGVAVALALVAVCAIAVLGQGGGVTIERADTPSAETGEAPSTEARSEGQSAGHEEIDDVEDEPARLLVHVDGAVNAPGVYELLEGSRVNDAVSAAGGLRGDAETTAINLAAEVRDGEKIHVPAVGEPVTTAPAGQDGLGASDAAPININTADVTELDELPGVGESTARAIVEDREANGPFATPEDLMRVSGIGEKKFAKLEAMICV